MKTLVSCDRNLSWSEQIEKLNTLIPLKYATNINSEALSESTPSELLIKYIDIGSVDSTGNISQIGEFTFKNSPSRARRKVQQGDTIVSTVRTYLKAIAYIDQNESSLIASTGFAVLSAVRNVICSRYLYYWMRSDFVVDEICARSVGVSYPATNASEIGSISIPALPMERQKSIAHFLDRKTAAIDTLVAKKQRLIQLLEEKRTALINQAVTKGLNPIAPMKESGISWIGKIPKHWEVKKIKFVCRLETGHTPSRTEKSYWVENECTIPWVSLNDTKTLAILDYISDTKYKISALGMANSSAHLIESGAVVFTRDATIGLAAITIRPMAVSQHIIAWVCLKNIINNRFLLNTIYAMNGELERLTMGSTIKTIGMSDVKELRMPVPPLDDQVNIANQIDEQQGKLKDVISKVKKQLDKLQEYRRSLITAAVTGKLAISEVEPDV